MSEMQDRGHSGQKQKCIFEWLTAVSSCPVRQWVPFEPTHPPCAGGMRLRRAHTSTYFFTRRSFRLPNVSPSGGLLALGSAISCDERDLLVLIFAAVGEFTCQVIVQKTVVSRSRSLSLSLSVSTPPPRAFHFVSETSRSSPNRLRISFASTISSCRPLLLSPHPSAWESSRRESRPRARFPSMRSP